MLKTVKHFETKVSTMLNVSSRVNANPSYLDIRIFVRQAMDIFSIMHSRRHDRQCHRNNKIFISGADLGFSEGRGPNFRKGANQYKTKNKLI